MKSEHWLDYLNEVPFAGEVPGNTVIHGKPLFESVSSKAYVRYVKLFMVHTLKSIGFLGFPSIICILFNLAVSHVVENHILLWRGRPVS